MNLLLLAIISVVGLFMSMMLTASEMALTVMTPSRAEALLEDGVKGADIVARRAASRTTFVASLVMLALAARIAIVASAVVYAQQRWGAAGVWGSAIVTGVFLLVLAELAPRLWALRNLDRAAPIAAQGVEHLERVAPLRWLANGAMTATRLIVRTPVASAAVTSEDEVVALADAAVEAAVLSADEGEIIHSLVEFGDTLVREAMVARPDVVAIPSEQTVADTIASMNEAGVSRAPVVGNDIDDVRGIVHIKDLYERQQRGRGEHFATIARREPHFVPETKPAFELLRELRGMRHSMVIVIDEYGGMAGIVTMEDLIEEILGEITDEFDRDMPPSLELLHDGEWLIHGRLPIDEFNEQLDADLPADDWDTVGGLIIDALGRVPDAEETLSTGGYLLTVEEVVGRRITRVRVQRDG